MRITDKKDIKPRQTIWCGYDDRPIDGYGYSKGVVTQVFDDHYVYRDIDNDIDDVWGLFEKEESSIANFTTKDEVLNWLGLGR